MSKDNLTWTITEDESNQRLDAFLVNRCSGLSRAKIQRAIAKGLATVDGKSAKPSLRIVEGQVVEFEPPEVQSEAPIPEDIPLDILFEDEHVVAINKPPAMVVHPAKGHWAGTLTAALAFHFENLSDLGGVARPGIVHRLDRDTSGVILVAKNNEAHAHLSAQFEQRTIEKTYWSIVSPAPDRDRDRIDQPIGAHPYQREKKAIRHNHSTSKSAESFYEVIERFQGFGVVEVRPKTGRTHQIRVHMAHVGCAVLCDRLYSGRAELFVRDVVPTDSQPSTENENDKLLLGRQALHAKKICFTHPVSAERVELEAPVAEDLCTTLDAIRKFRGTS